MMFLLKATIYARTLNKYKEAIKVYTKAEEIISKVQGAKMNPKTLLDNVIREREECMALYEAQEGETIDLDELSQEEDADIREDFKPQIHMMWATQPFMLIKAQI